MSRVHLDAIDYRASFQKDFRKAPANVQEAVESALECLLQNPQPSKLRLHSLNGYFNPKIFKVDVFPNRSWQITFEIDGSTAILRRLARHHDVDRRP